MDRFKRIDEEQMSGPQVKQIHDQIIEDLSFLVYSNTSKYKKFSNYEDLNQEGFVGLIKATKRFNHKLFPNFFVFANQWIINGIRRSAKKHDVMYSPQRIKTVYCGFSEDLSAVDEKDGPDEVFEKAERADRLYKAMGLLGDRERKIVSILFGVDSKKQTLRESEKCFNLTYERIRQIKNKALEKLRDSNILIEIGD
jgi:RNA polymerase sigma factor (sigma-70 family)